MFSKGVLRGCGFKPSSPYPATKPPWRGAACNTKRFIQKIARHGIVAGAWCGANEVLKRVFVIQRANKP